MSTPRSTPEPAWDPDCEIVSRRVFAAPRERVFAAWTDPVHLAVWWGPKGFTNTFEAFEPVPGGAWRFVMHGPDGTDYPNQSVFVEVEAPSRLVFDHVSGHRFRVVATFEAADGGTEVTFRMRFESAEACAEVRDFVVPANEENFNRLEAELGRMG
ncbi:SRPBCC family protein [Geothrix sp. 21YS21S-4]|uniref:SRPBCC family protein n=1 Tax=Geothrix sp. 21YS21S-4 TaxID=3068889 RepID=UPI0027BAEB64|nr:SRPBCC family protein [Geothrix sp. 21YS21S-4]